jgi:hypothetical protein
MFRFSWHATNDSWSARHLKVPRRVESSVEAPGTTVPPGSHAMGLAAPRGRKVALAPIPHPHPAVRPAANSRGHIRPAMITQQTAEPGQQQAGRAVAASGWQQRGRRPVVTMAKPAGRWPSLDVLSGRSPMAELSAAPPAGVAASERNILLATKLHLPRLQPAAVPGAGHPRARRRRRRRGRAAARCRRARVHGCDR